MATAVALPGHDVEGIVPPGELAAVGIVQAVPIVKVPWFDDRQTCKMAHDYLEDKTEGRFEEYSCCSSYAAGVCSATRGAGLLCLFHESDRSLAWALARRWQRIQLSDGTTALQRRQ